MTMSIYSARATRIPVHKPMTPFEYQFPISDYYTELMTSTTKSSDPIALLSQRWQGIASQITSRRLERDTVVALNRNLDEVENILLWSAPEVQQGNAGLGLGILRDSGEEAVDCAGRMTPPASAEPDAPEVVELEPRIQVENEANTALMERLSKAVDQLRQRQEEFKHLHNVATAKAEEGAERILQLESDVEQLEGDVLDDQSELSYLKLKLRILEIQTLPYVPSEEKDQLAEGIRRWKLDWADVDKRFHARRRKKGPNTNLDWRNHSVEHTV